MSCVALLVASAYMPGDSRAVGEGMLIWPLLAWFALAFAWSIYQYRFSGVLLRTDWTLGLWLVATIGMLISLGVHREWGDFRTSLNLWWQWSGYAIALMLCLQLIRSGREMRGVVAVMVAAAVALAVVGIYDSLVQIPGLRSEYFSNTEAGRIEMLQQAGIQDAAVGSPQRYHFESRLQSPEPFVTFSLTNSLAGFLAPWLTVLLGIVFTIQWQGRDRRLLIRLLLICLTLAVCLVLTKSRSAWCAILIVVGVMVAIQSRSNQRLFYQGMGVICLLVALAALIGWYTNRLDWRILSDSFTSLWYRFEYWGSSVQMAMDHWMWGVGPGNYQDTYALYKLPVASESVADPHNALLEIWTSFGSLVGVIFVGLAAIVVKRMVRPVPVQSIERDSTSGNTIFLSGLLGVLLAAGMDALGPGLIPERALYLGLPVFAVTIYLLQDWVERGEITRLQLAMALIVWTLNLSMQSGIGVPGIAITGWLIVSMILNLDSKTAVKKPEGQRASVGCRCLRRVERAGVCAGMLVLLMGFYLSCHRPVSTANQHLNDAAYYSRLGNPARAFQEIEDAIRADPYSAKGHVQKAELLYYRLRRDISAENLKIFRESIDRVIQANPNSHPLYAALAQQCIVVYQATGQHQWLVQSRELTRKETQLYPNSAFSWARLALCDYLLKRPTAADSADRALMLDQQNPHVEFKLSNRKFLELSLMDWTVQKELSINNSKTLEQLVVAVRTQ